MGVGRGAEGVLGPSLDFEIWHFSIKFLAKKAVFLVSSGKMIFNHCYRQVLPEHEFLYMKSALRKNQ